MSKINFKELKVYLDITHERTETIDARKPLGDLIYQRGSGIASLDLAMRIFKSEGEVELSAEDMESLKSIINANSSAAFIDSFNNNIHD